MSGQNDLGPFGTDVNEASSTPDFGDSGGGSYTWFKDCTSPTTPDGTKFTAQWANRLMQYVRRACDGMGIARNEADLDRLLKAIQRAQVRSGYRLHSPVTPIPHNLATILANWSVDFNTVDDSAVSASAGTLTIGARDAGLWMFTASGGTSSPATYHEQIDILKNSVAVATHRIQLASDQVFLDLSTSVLIRCAVGDVIAVSYFQKNTGAVSTDSVNSTFIQFSGARLGP